MTNVTWRRVRPALVGPAVAVALAALAAGPTMAGATAGRAVTPSTVSLTALTNPPVPPGGGKYKAVVSPQPTGALADRGTMTFTDDGVDIPGCVGLAVYGGGLVSCNERAQPGGVHTIVAAYSGDAVQGAASGTMQETYLQRPTFTSAATLTVGVGSPFTYTVTCIGYPAPTTLVQSKTVPAWLTVTPNGDGTATVSGTPSKAGTVSLLFTATTAAGSTRGPLTIHVT